MSSIEHAVDLSDALVHALTSTPLSPTPSINIPCNPAKLQADFANLQKFMHYTASIMIGIQNEHANTLSNDEALAPYWLLLMNCWLGEKKAFEVMFTGVTAKLQEAKHHLAKLRKPQESTEHSSANATDFTSSTTHPVNSESLLTTASASTNLPLAPLSSSNAVPRTTKSRPRTRLRILPLRARITRHNHRLATEPPTSPPPPLPSTTLPSPSPLPFVTQPVANKGTLPINPPSNRGTLIRKSMPDCPIEINLAGLPDHTKLAIQKQRKILCVDQLPSDEVNSSAKAVLIRNHNQKHKSSLKKCGGGNELSPSSLQGPSSSPPQSGAALSAAVPPRDTKGKAKATSPPTPVIPTRPRAFPEYKDRSRSIPGTTRPRVSSPLNPNSSSSPIYSDIKRQREDPINGPPSTKRRREDEDGGSVSKRRRADDTGESSSISILGLGDQQPTLDSGRETSNTPQTLSSTSTSDRSPNQTETLPSTSQKRRRVKGDGGEEGGRVKRRKP